VVVGGAAEGDTTHGVKVIKSNNPETSRIVRIVTNLYLHPSKEG